MSGDLLVFGDDTYVEKNLLLFNQIIVLLLAKQLGFGVPLSLESNSLNSPRANVV
jgi:hypothetical protein